MSYLSVWLPPERRSDLASQRYVLTRLVNSGVLADDVVAYLRQIAHILAAVEDAVRLSDV